MRLHKVIFLIVLLAALIALAKDKKAPIAAPEELAQTTARGRALFNYARAVWQANQALTSMKVSQDDSAEYIAQKTDTGWTVAVGSLNETKDIFRVVYEISQTGTEGKLSINQRPREDTNALAAAARATETAKADFGQTQRPYNTAVLSAGAGQLYVYLYPAVVKKGVLPLGGDVRYTISADGKNIIEKRPLHKTIMETTTSSPGETVGGVHTHVLTDVPEDTDVLHAMLRRMPETIGVGGHAYQVEADGTIRVLGK
jgi:hypothetical protein